MTAATATSSGKDLLVQCLGLVVFCVVGGLFVYFIPSEQYGKEMMNKMTNHAKIKDVMSRFTSLESKIVKKDRETIRNLSPSCKLALVENSLKTKHVSQFFSSILPSEKYEKIANQLSEQVTDQTFNKCEKQIDFTNLKINLNLEKLKSNQVIIIDLNFMKKMEELSFLQSSLQQEQHIGSCSQRVIESILIQKELHDISTLHNITTLDKAVNFYGQLWLRQDCSESISTISKSSDLLKEYSHLVNQQDVDKLYQLLDVEPSDHLKPLEPRVLKSIFQEQEKKIVNAQIDKLEKQIGELKNTIGEFENQSKILSRTISEKEKEYKMSLEKSQAENDKLQVLIREKQVSISSLESKQKSLTEEVVNYQRSVSNLKSDLEKEFEKYKAINLKNIQLEDSNNKLTQKSKDLENEIKKKIPSLEENIQLLNKEKTTMEKQIQELKNSTYTDLISGREKIFKQAEVLQQTGKNIDTIGGLLNQFNETLKGDESLRERIGQLLDKLEKQQKSQKELEEIMSKSKHLEVEGKECFSALSVCREEKSKLLNDKQVEKLVLKVSSLEKKIEALNQEKQELVSKVGDYSNTISEIEQKKNEAIERSENLSTILVDLKLEHVEEQKRNKLTIETLEQELNETKQLLNQTSTQHSTEHTQNEQLQNELTKIKDQFTTCQTSSETILEENRKLLLELEEIKKDLVIAQSAKIVSDLKEEDN